MYTCTKCGRMGCTSKDLDKTLPHCPSKDMDIQDAALKEYQKKDIHDIAYHSACTEAGGYGVDTRLVEIVKFLKGMECKKIGLAFCKGLTLEAREVAKGLEHHGFEVVSVICKNGAVPKADIGVEDENTLSGSAENEVMCNPIGQAMTLNKEKTDFNIIMGLCVGHDTLFLKYAEAPVTVFAVKDRVTGHNPLAAVYCANSYYKKKLYGENK